MVTTASWKFLVAFKIRKCPTKPQRIEKLQKRFQVALPIPVSLLKSHIVHLPENAEIKSGHYSDDSDYYGNYSCYDSNMLEFVWYVAESDDEFAKRMATYETDLADYNNWFSKNKEKIELETKKKLAVKLLKEEKEKIRNQERISQLERELEKLKNK